MSILTTVLTVSGLTPEFPLARTLALKSMVALTASRGRKNPAPDEWLRTRFLCSSSIFSGGMMVLHIGPTPVSTP